MSNPIIKRFLKQTEFSSEEDYSQHLEFIIPKNFNFAYDVVDEWAKLAPQKIALLWTNDKGEERRVSFLELKKLSDQAASYLLSLGIERGDMVMLILKRRLEWWICLLALHKMGAIAIPATHMLTKHDIIYRNNAASVKAIICVGEEYVLREIEKSIPDSPTVDTLVSIGPLVPEGFHDWHAEIGKAPQFVKPRFVNTNEDTMIMYFTSGTTGEPKMVAHDFLYALGHLTTGVFWHNLHEDSIHLTLTQAGERLSGGSSTANGLLEPASSSTTTTSSQPTRFSTRSRNTISPRSALLQRSTASSSARISPNTTSPPSSTARRLARRSTLPSTISSAN